MSRLLFAAGILLLSSMTIHADDATKAKLDRATQAYDATMKSIHQEIIKNLTAREETARREGKTELVEQIKAERQALRDDGAGTLVPASASAMTRGYYYLLSSGQIDITNDDAAGGYTSASTTAWSRGGAATTT